VVGEHHRGADEHAVGERGGLVHERVVLHLTVVAHPHAGADVRAAPDDAVPPEHRVLAHLREVPDRAAAADARALGDIGGRHYPPFRLSHSSILSAPPGIMPTTARAARSPAAARETFSRAHAERAGRSRSGSPSALWASTA